MLLSTAITPAAIGVITSSQNVDLYAMDAVRGQEKDIVILCTTRSHFEAERSQFLNDPMIECGAYALYARLDSSRSYVLAQAAV
ncbi:hypothetical protein Q1695_005533 [Nippostrongylus brasiliensis]|nr:hypothetical protein Q1695_005533 [Nippostrongylus brasiliensis]